MTYKQYLENKNSKIKIFTHNDLDGAMPVVMLKALFNAEVHYKMCNYNNINQRVNEFFLSGEYRDYDYIFITDISIQPSVAMLIDQKIFKENIFVRLIDHHNNEDVQYLADTFSWCKINYDSCASKLFLKYLQFMFPDSEELKNPVIEELIEMTNDWDTWKWVENNNQRAVDLNTLVYQYGKLRFIDTFTQRIKDALKDPSTKVFNDFESELLAIVNENKLTYMKGKLKDMQIFESTNNGKPFKIALIYNEQHTSELAEYIFKNSDETIDLVQMVNLSTGMVSVRSKTDVVNANEIAQLHGGNGHPAAAGYTLKSDAREKVYDVTCCV